MKNSLGDIERYYAAKARKVPHVISHYTAGARLIGLNDRQLEMCLRQMQKAAKNQDSPYAKPLQFVMPARKKRTTKKREKKIEATKSNCDELDTVEPKEVASITDEHDDHVQYMASQARGRRRTAFVATSENMDIFVSLLHYGIIFKKTNWLKIVLY